MNLWNVSNIEVHLQDNRDNSFFILNCKFLHELEISELLMSNWISKTYDVIIFLRVVIWGDNADGRERGKSNLKKDLKIQYKNEFHLI